MNALVRPRLAPLDPSEHRELAKRTLPLLYEAWGGSEEERTFPREVELTRLALLAVDGVVLNHTAARAVHWLKESFEYHKALDWAQNSIDVIEKCGLPISVQLLRQAGDVSNIIGEYSRAERYYDAVLRRVDAGELMHSTDLSATMISQGRVLRQMGRPMDALRCFSLAQEVSKATDDLKEYVVALGEAANSCAERGDLDAALVSHSECLSLHEKLGDSRGYAITLGEIARILTERGQFDEALALHERQVKVLVELDDRRSAAIASGDIAKLKRLSGDLQGALEIHESELQIYAALGDRRSHAVTLGDLAITLRDMGKEELALKLQHERLAENREIGDALGQAAALHDIAKIELSRSRPDQAFPLLAEAFGLADQVHAEPWVCAIGYLYAPLLAMRGKVKVALGILERVKAGGEHLRSPGIREDILAMISILKKVERSTRRR
ncbi:MAG: hypothetical protein JWM33_2055 [Caulobacteraceae bacterium]|nr:hypothetical protein [Caulobacteraceae bacterium]